MKLPLTSKWHLAALFFCVTPVLAVPQRLFFSPTATDPAITTFTNNHYAVTDPDVPARGKLMVFLPGTGGVPFVYTRFVENAASLGFHSLGLMYPNGESINELCRIHDPFNPDAAAEARLEVIDGTDRVPYLSVNRPNSIENRLLKALQYLHARVPARGWHQFLSGDNIVWQKIAVCGHSQGGGHAAFLGKTRLIDRSVNFCATDWWSYGARLYNWLSQSSVTSVANAFMMAHHRDEQLGFPGAQTTAATLDLTRYGAFVNAEATDDATFGGRHFLSTNLEPKRGSNGSYHGAAVTDLDTPLQPDGTPVLKRAWDFMLLHITPPVALHRTTSELTVTFSPGTLEQSADLQSWNSLTTATSPYVRSRGNLAPAEFFRLQAP